VTTVDADAAVMRPVAVSVAVIAVVAPDAALVVTETRPVALTLATVESEELNVSAAAANTCVEPSL
jgi:hypothetical protein